MPLLLHKLAQIPRPIRIHHVALALCLPIHKLARVDVAIREAELALEPMAPSLHKGPIVHRSICGHLQPIPMRQIVVPVATVEGLAAPVLAPALALVAHPVTIVLAAVAVVHDPLAMLEPVLICTLVCIARRQHLLALAMALPAHPLASEYGAIGPRERRLAVPLVRGISAHIAIAVGPSVLALAVALVVVPGADILAAVRKLHGSFAVPHVVFPLTRVALNLTIVRGHLKHSMPAALVELPHPVVDAFPVVPAQHSLSVLEIVFPLALVLGAGIGLFPKSVPLAFVPSALVHLALASNLTRQRSMAVPLAVAGLALIALGARGAQKLLGARLCLGLGLLL
eukprot:comp21557_c0_seq1/m.47238 comp21557_c0_seq1/g.47238  ORF comp21557_c0_seq1/g.47238 comp21557_c0_seq1/m.47238 type:complete len:341 (-) comp21557_c0_seq1:1259-2281(-)